MASVLYQSIEALSRDKGIDPQIVVSAVEDAIALATRKYYKTQENMRAELDRESGEIRAYVYKTVVEAPEQLEDPVNQITLEEAETLAPGAEVGSEIRINNFGEVAIGNPELVLANEPHAVGAVLSYRFDAKTGEHILRLLR